MPLDVSQACQSGGSKKCCGRSSKSKHDASVGSATLCASAGSTVDPVYTPGSQDSTPEKEHNLLAERFQTKIEILGEALVKAAIETKAWFFSSDATMAGGSGGR